MQLRNRNLFLFVTLLLMSAAMMGCASKKPALAPPPPTVNLTPEPPAPEVPSVSWLRHDAVGLSKKPGDSVGCTARANVPDGHRLVVNLLDTSWEVPLTPGPDGTTFTGRGAIPDLPLPARSYQAKARLLNAQGEEVAGATADQPLFIVPGARSCRELQADLEKIRIPFDYDEFALSEGGKQALAVVIQALKGFGRTAALEIEGHCDERGTNEYNLSLSDKRAGMVRDYLVTVGVAARADTKVIPYGEERPRNPGHDEQAWAENRRVEIKVSCRMD